MYTHTHTHTHTHIKNSCYEFDAMPTVTKNVCHILCTAQAQP